MRNKILGCFAVLAVAAVAAWNVNVSSQTKGMSDVMLANVEALAEESTTCCIGSKFRVESIPGGWHYQNDEGNSCCPIC